MHGTTLILDQSILYADIYTDDNDKNLFLEVLGITSIYCRQYVNTNFI